MAPDDESARRRAPSEVAARALRHEQYRALLRTTPTNSVINVLTASIFFAVFLSHDARLFLYVWACGIALILLLRVVILTRSRISRFEQDAFRWPFHALTLSSVVSGLLWGTAGAVLLPEADPTQQVFLVVVASALVGGSATTLSSAPVAAMGFALGVTLPIAGHFASMGDLAYTGLAALSLFFGLAMSYASRGAYRQFREQVRIRFENDLLAAKITAERSQWLELSASAEAFALFDRDNRLLLWNPAFQRALSLPPGNLTLGALFADLLSIGVRPVELLENRRALDNWIAALTPPTSGARAPASYRMSNGRWLRITSYRTAGGGAILHMVDVTELKTQEMALRSAQSELAALAQEKKDGFASLVRRHKELKEAMSEIVHARDEALQSAAAQF